MGRKKDDPIEVDEAAVAEAILAIDEAKADKEVAEKRRKAAQTELVTTLLGSDRDEIEVDNPEDPDGPRLTAKVVQPKRTEINATTLKKKLGAAKWKRVSTTVVDRKKLDAQVKAGEVDMADVAECSVITPTEAYINSGRSARIEEE